MKVVSTLSTTPARKDVAAGNACPLFPSSGRFSRRTLELEEHRELQAPRDPFSTVDEHFRDLRRAAVRDSLPEMTEPRIEILLADLL